MGKLAQQAAVQVGGEQFIFKEEQVLSLYDDGTVKEGQLAYDAQVSAGGRRFHLSANKEGYRFASVQFYPSGRIRSGCLAENTTVRLGRNEIVFGQKSRIWFYEDGGIQDGVLAAPTLLRVGAHEIYFAVDSDWTVDEMLDFMWWRGLVFYPNGSIKRGMLHRDVCLPVGQHSLVFQQGSGLLFYENGAVAFGMTKAIGLGIEAKDGYEPCYFDAQGNVVGKEYVSRIIHIDEGEML